MEDLRYPIGNFAYTGPLTESERSACIARIAAAPAKLRAAIAGLSDSQLDTPYRPGGWTVRQVTHHVPESHMNAYVRFKLALTEDTPTIKPYMEDRWALLGDVQSTPLEVSLLLLDALHDRWVRLLRNEPPPAPARPHVHSHAHETRLIVAAREGMPVKEADPDPDPQPETPPVVAPVPAPAPPALELKPLPPKPLAAPPPEPPPVPLECPDGARMVVHAPQHEVCGLRALLDRDNGGVLGIQEADSRDRGAVSDPGQQLGGSLVDVESGQRARRGNRA